jgi:N-acetylneuraminate synthase
MEYLPEGLSMSKPVFIIAEAGVNHNGRLDLAMQLIEAARAAGADAVKFQTFKTEKVMTREVGMADYQRQNLGRAESQFEMVKRLELSYQDFVKLRDHARQIGILFLSTPDESESLDFLCDTLDLSWLKVGSGEITNFPFLRQIAKKRRPTILSTGMCDLGEVERALIPFQEAGCPELIVLHCTTNYPCPPEEVNLHAMVTLRDAFKVRVGYSDHTLGIDIPIAAVALGAEVIEKHFTLDKSMVGPDHLASLDPVELGEMVRSIRRVEAALGDGIKRPNPSELQTKQLVRRHLVSARRLEAGTILCESDLTLKRASAGIGPECFELVSGRKLLASLEADSPLSWNHLFPG